MNKINNKANQNLNDFTNSINDDIDLHDVTNDNFIFESVISELEDYSYDLNLSFQEYINSTGANIGKNINSIKIFDFTIDVLNHFEN